MKVVLIKQPSKNLNALSQILNNRGVTNLGTYVQTTDAVVSPAEMLGEENLKAAAQAIAKAIQNNSRVMLVVDADNDGFTSAALLLNYLHRLFPTFVENNIKYFLHSGKQHGLSDCIDLALKYDLVILPDGGSNNYEEHRRLKEQNTEVIVLDHHEAEKISENAIIINNQLCDYPNKELSGVGVVYQFCRYLDSIFEKNYADDYLDLVASGLMGDMMSLRSIETKHLIFKGLKEENIHNPFIYGLAKKNSYSLNKTDYKPSRINGLAITPMGAAFFIVPFVNAIVRSGTMEEKEIVFKSMLDYEAYKEVPSTKRGHKPGDTETIVDQALRVCTNVKNRQTKAQDAGVSHLESMIESQHLLDHKVLLFLLEPGTIDKNIAGLAANKFMAKYQRPVCILTKVIDNKTGYVSYQGSARGYGADMLFKDICSAAPGCIFAEGHQGAFGLGIDCGYSNDENQAEVCGESIYQFIDYTDNVLADLGSEITYYVDYQWDVNEVDGDKIIEIAEMNDYWGKDIDRALVYVTNIRVNKDNFLAMKSNTLKYILPVADIIQFGGTETEIDYFTSGDTIIINAVCKCCINDYNWQISPQLQMVEYEIVGKETASTDATTLWDF